jgi:hypothetical protein
LHGRLPQWPRLELDLARTSPRRSSSHRGHAGPYPELLGPPRMQGLHVDLQVDQAAGQGYPPRVGALGLAHLLAGEPRPLS